MIWGTERCLYVAGLGVDENIAREEEMVEPLMTLWLGGLYGVTGSSTGKRKAKPVTQARRQAHLTAQFR